MRKDEYNLAVFKSIREEINRRIDTHFKLVLAKFALGGGIFAFLVGKDVNLEVSPYFTTAIFLLLFDVLVLENLGWIRNAGHFIKQHIESNQQNIIRWESEFAQANSKWVCFTKIGYMLGIWIIAPAFLLAGFILDYEHIDKVNVALLIIASYQCCYTFFLICQMLGVDVARNSTATKSLIFSDNSGKAGGRCKIK